MANSRLWAVCRICNEAECIMKYYPIEWYFVNEETEWFIEHPKTHEKEIGIEGGGGEFIEFVRECGDEERVQLFDFRRELNDGKIKIYLKNRLNKEEPKNEEITDKKKS